MKVSLLSYKYPIVDGPKTGVFSKIPIQDRTVNERCLKTTYMDDYLKKFEEFNPKLTSQISNEGIPSGQDMSKIKPETIKITTCLISEKFKSKFKNLINRFK